MNPEAVLAVGLGIVLVGAGIVWLAQRKWAPQHRKVEGPTFLSDAQIVEDYIHGLSGTGVLLSLAVFEEKELFLLHHTVGRYIRNTYHLWDENNPYRFKPIVVSGHGVQPAREEEHPDDRSHRIIVAIWTRAQAVHPTIPEAKRLELRKTLRLREFKPQQEHTGWAG